METEIRTAIYDLTIGAEYLNNDNLFWGQARQGAEYPFCVLSLVTNPRYRDTNTSFEEFFLQFTIYGNVLEDIETIEGEIMTLWDGRDTTKAAINALLTNWQVVGVYGQHRESRPIDETYWQNFMRYKLELEPKIS